MFILFSETDAITFQDAQAEFLHIGAARRFLHRLAPARM